jgi:hypothetical protein
MASPALRICNEEETKSEDSVDIYPITGPTGKRYVGQASVWDRHGRPRGAEKRWRVRKLA